jgi:hypothetical protein
VPPYDEGNAFATMTKVVTEEPPRCSRCAGDLGALIGDLMARDPAHRPDVDEARTRLAAAERSSMSSAPAYPTEPLPPSFDRTMALERAVASPAGEVVTPAPAPGPTPQPPRRSRTLLALALLAAAVLAGVLAFLLTAPSPQATPQSRTSPEATTSPPAAKQSASSRATGAGNPADSGLPSGWRRYTDSAVGWSVGVPPGWTVRQDGSSTYFRDPAGGRYLLVDTKYPAGPSAKGAWEDQERSFRATHSGYQRIALDNVHWRDYPDVADWEFTYTSGAATLHAVDRGAVVGNRGYGLFFQTHSDQWDGSGDILRGIYASFRPG